MFTAFVGNRRIAQGEFAEVDMAARQAMASGVEEPVLVFDDETGEQTYLEPRGPGRPKLGVVAREVTLLPRHWDWLGSQPGGASVALRKLVESARRENEGRDRQRKAREAAYRFSTALAGNQPGYEEALRALFAGDRQGFELHTAAWPADVRAYALSIAAPGFE